MLSKIESQRFELIRDAIGRVLCAEITDQVKLQPIGFENIHVCLERTVPFDKTELPAINICYVESRLTDENTAFESTYDNKFFIEVYANAKSEMNAKGDKLSAVLVTKIMGMVRAILRNERYYYLDFEEKFIQSRKVENIARTQPRIQNDNENTASGVVEVHYFASETTELETGTLAGYLDTTVKLVDTEKGYKFIINE